MMGRLWPPTMERKQVQVLTILAKELPSAYVEPLKQKKITVSETSTIVSSIVRDANGIILSRDIQLVDALDEKKTIGDIFDIQRITDIEVDETDE